MNNFLNRLERKIGRYAISHLTMLIIGCYIVGYVIAMINSDILGYMYLDPYYILHGQIWRLVTWIVVPPDSMNIFTIIMLFFYFSIGTSLERAWGDFRYNVYIASGMLISIVTAFISYFAASAIIGTPVIFGGMFSTYYICMSILLAFAFTFPDARVLLWFIIPLKVKWLGIVYCIFIGYDIFTDVRYFIMTKNPMFLLRGIAVIASLANFLIFFFSTRSRNSFYKNKSEIFGGRQRKHSKAGFSNNRSFDKTVKDVKGIARHRCCVCGRTEITDPELEFRFCSKCAGGKEYCMDHIFTHEHS